MPFHSDDLIGVHGAEFTCGAADDGGRSRAQLRTAGLEQLVFRQLNSDHVAVAADVDVGQVDPRQRVQEAVVGHDGNTAATLERGGQRTRFVVARLAGVLRFGQPTRDVLELITQRPQLIFHDFVFLAGLRQQ